MRVAFQRCGRGRALSGRAGIPDARSDRCRRDCARRARHVRRGRRRSYFRRRPRVCTCTRPAGQSQRWDSDSRDGSVRLRSVLRGRRASALRHLRDDRMRDCAAILRAGLDHPEHRGRRESILGCRGSLGQRARFFPGRCCVTDRAGCTRTCFCRRMHRRSRRRPDRRRGATLTRSLSARVDRRGARSRDARRPMPGARIGNSGEHSVSRGNCRRDFRRVAGNPGSR